MPDKPSVVALACSDLHLCAKPPLARSNEPSWRSAMLRPLLELRKLVNEHGVPVVIAGDLFDRWNPAPEMLSLCFRHLPNDVYAIPGQHDMPCHNWKDLKKSGFWTLVEAGRIKLLEPGEPQETATGVQLWGFPFGFPVKPLKKPHDLLLEVAVVHDYLWIEGKEYEGAPKEKNLFKRYSKIWGYDIAVFGDNHKGFLHDQNRPTVLNCGCFIRRKQDERDYEPCVGLIMSDGTVKRHKLDCSKDVFLDPEKAPAIAEQIGFSSFVESLSELGQSAIDFADAIKRTLERDKVPEEVKALILAVLERAKDA